MKYLTNEKLTIVGAGGAIGSNMAQTALMLGLTPNICLYDIYAPGVEGVAEEMRHCGFEGANVTWTVDPKEAFTDAKYIISSGGAPRKEGMTREDLLKGNCQIAAQFGDYIREYCPDVKHVVVIFNPADVTASPLSTQPVCRATSQRSSAFLRALSPEPTLTADTVSRWQFSLPR